MKPKFYPALTKKLEKLDKRNPVLSHAIDQKIRHILANPEHYKPLRNEMKGFRRVHFGSYVLIYRFHDDIVEFIDIDHHDDAY